MIQYYQELLNECIDIQEMKVTYKSMFIALVTMKNKLRELKGEKHGKV